MFPWGAPGGWVLQMANKARGSWVQGRARAAWTDPTTGNRKAVSLSSCTAEGPRESPAGLLALHLGTELWQARSSDAPPPLRQDQVAQRWSLPHCSWHPTPRPPFVLSPAWSSSLDQGDSLPPLLQSLHSNVTSSRSLPRATCPRPAPAKPCCLQPRSPHPLTLLHQFLSNKLLPIIFLCCLLSPLCNMPSPQNVSSSRPRGSGLVSFAGVSPGPGTGLAHNRCQSIFCGLYELGKHVLLHPWLQPGAGTPRQLRPLETASHPRTHSICVDAKLRPGFPGGYKGADRQTHLYVFFSEILLHVCC